MTATAEAASAEVAHMACLLLTLAVTVVGGDDSASLADEKPTAEDVA